MRWCLTAALWCLLLIPATAQQETIAPDTTKTIQRTFDDAQLDQLRADRQLQYKSPPSVAETLWERILNLFSDFLGWLFRGAVTTPWGKVLLYVLGIGVMIYIILLLLKVDGLRIFYSGTNEVQPHAQIIHENIHEMNFEALIADAASRQDYRLAVRLMFLYALKILSDRHVVDWKPGKTNHDYVNEVKSTQLRSGLQRLSTYFDYAWYGGFEVNRGLFERVNQVFTEWRKTAE